uniref:Family with sequence similarity 81 member B n=1 Tax=Sphaeramia orbicularis TaxID=375764 RepID=A0A673CHA0_9TELE
MDRLAQLHSRRPVLPSDNTNMQTQESQDRTLAVLLEQAFRIKEEVAASILSAQGSVQTEALSRRLLESHILTITRIVKQLSQVLEGHIAQRDSVTTGTTLAVQCMDQKNMVGIGDLRGRVARYGSQSRVKITLRNYCINTTAIIVQVRSRLADRLHALEARVEQFETQWDKSTIRHADHLKRSESILNKRVASVENSLHQELQLLKQNYDKGFASVRDAIESLKQIGDIKSRLEEEKIQKDIRDICSKVAELSEL